MTINIFLRGEMVDTSDSKSDALGVPVRVRSKELNLLLPFLHYGYNSG